MIITLQHLSTVPGFGAKPGLCRTQAREWCKRYGVDWDEFRRSGIDEAKLAHIDDPFLSAIIAHAHGTENGRK